MPNALKIPSIELPRNDDLKSMQNAIAQIKEAIEIMTGVRGGDSYFPTREDLSLMQARARKLEKNAWETVYDSSFSGVTTVPVLNLGQYENLRVTAHVLPSATSTPIYGQFSSDNGATWIGGASSYMCDLIYMQSGVVGTPVGGTLTTSGLAFGFANPITAANVNGYGMQIDMVFHNVNKAGIQTTGQGTVDYLTNVVVKGSFFMRPGDGTLAVACNAFRLLSSGAAANIQGTLLVEGRKG